MRGKRIRMEEAGIGLDVEASMSVFGHYRGVFMVLLGAVLWGVSGSAAQVLFQQTYLDPAWLVNLRMTASGLLILLYTGFRFGPMHVFSLWRTVKDAARLVILAIFGLLGVQYTYFVAIADSNAATATLLQYLAPVMVVLWTLFRTKSRPQPRHAFAVLAAVVGTSLLVTNGKFGVLGISLSALVWGLVSALSLAFYTIYPRKLLHRYGSLPVVGWCMFIGGMVMGVRHPVWHLELSSLSIGSWYLITFVVVFGTMVAFMLFTSSLKLISSQQASLLSCAEPLASAIFAVLFLHLRLSLLGWTGAFAILAAVVVLSRAKQ